MNPERLVTTEAPLNHPDDDALRALSSGQLSEVRLAQVSAHLSDCPTCCSRIDQLATGDQLLARLQQTAATPEDVLVNTAQRRSAVRALRQSRHTSSATLHAPPSAHPGLILPAPKKVGDYEILSEVGRGGMGVVYKARHRGLNRLAALKMVLVGEFASPAQELRFRLEAELAARVHHPNIVQVYEIGSYEGRPFLALEWVEGGSLANRLDGNQWPPDEAASLVETLARAIDVAHNEGVIHRDLKPANILLGDHRSDPDSSLVPHPSSLFPKIADFGLAQPIEGGQTMTQSGFLVGTPGYMAPEQAGGKRALVGPATDIYSLGVMLYQLLTGQLPFQRDSTLELLKAVTSEEPARPRRLQPRLPRDLEAITLHCLEKEPARRYDSAIELAEDLRRFRAGEVITARPPSRIERTRKFVWRNKAVVAGAMATGLALMFGTVFSLLFAFREARQRNEAERSAHSAEVSAHEADQARRLALRETYQARLTTAIIALREGNFREAARQIEAAPAGLRGWEWQHLNARVSDLSPIVLQAAPEFDELGMYFPPGERLLVRKNDRWLLVDQKTRSVLRDLCNISAWRGSVRTSQGLMLSYARPGGGTTLLEETGAEMNISVSWNHGEWLAASRDRKLLAVWNREGPDDRRLRLFELPSGHLRLTIAIPEELTEVAFSPDGKQLAGATKEPSVVLWDAASGTKKMLHGHTSRVHGVAYHPDGKRLMSGSADRTVRQWDVSTGQTINVWRGHNDAVLHVTYSRDGQWIASSSADGTVRVWTTDDSKPPIVLAGHAGTVYQSFFSSDGLTISSVCHPRERWSIWRTPAAASRLELRGHSSFVYPVVFSPDGRLLASAGWDDDHGIRLWDAVSGTLVGVLTGHQEMICSLAFSPDSRRLISRSDDATMRVWDIETGRAVAVLSCDHIGFRGGPLNVVVTPDGQRILTGTNDGLRSWDLGTGEEQGRVRLPLGNVRVLAVRSTDGLVAASGDTPNIVLYDLKAGQVRAVLGYRTESGVCFHSLAFSPDGRQLLSAGNARDIQLWDVASGRLVREFRGHSAEVFAAVFHPSGERIVSAGRDRVIRVWDPAQDSDLGGLLGHTDYIFSLSFDPDGTTLASGSGDSTIRLWETERLSRRLNAAREEQEARPAAERLIERLFKEEGTVDRVAERLRTETPRGAPLERAARIALYRRQRLAPP